jgi:hypothetical protein
VRNKKNVVKIIRKSMIYKKTTLNKKLKKLAKNPTKKIKYHQINKA